jgi:sugar lactone lactonase YvrE
MNMDARIQCVVQGADVLGEVPLWCERTNKLWWVDVRRPALQSYEPSTATHCAFRLPDGMLTGSIALCESGGFLLATNSGFYRYDPLSGQPPHPLYNPEADKPGNRLNDGKCDRRGRFWVGSMLDARREPEGALYRFDADLQCHQQLTGIVVPNAISWSPDDRTMYFADTHRQIIWAFDYDLDSGTLSRRRVFKDWTHQLGRPDGATVDAEGYIWNAMVATGQVVRLAPDGSIDRVIQMPVTNPTCPAFGGPDLATLYVTSHSQRMPAERLAQEPYAGGLFALDVGVKGLPEPRFAL